eukprot:SAG31_NODE_1586_length_7821_cov_3.086765_2_plen_123_part_00
MQKAFEPRIQSWLRVNPGWEYRFWTDADNKELIKTKFPEYLEMYEWYPENIQRADAIRYFILYEFGGVYADLDFEALQPLDQLLATPGYTSGLIIGQVIYYLQYACAAPKFSLSLLAVPFSA